MPVDGFKPTHRDCFRAIGFNTDMGMDCCQETIFFVRAGAKDEDPSEVRTMKEVGEEAVLEFVEYWENQVAVAKDYLRNGRNPKTHEWVKAKP